MISKCKSQDSQKFASRSIERKRVEPQMHISRKNEKTPKFLEKNDSINLNGNSLEIYHSDIEPLNKFYKKNTNSKQIDSNAFISDKLNTMHVNQESILDRGKNDTNMVQENLMLKCLKPQNLQKVSTKNISMNHKSYDNRFALDDVR